MNRFQLPLRFRPLGILCFSLSLLAGLSLAYSQEVIPLWTGPAPDSKGTTPDDIPSLTAFRPEKPAAPTSAVIICPGGAYALLAFQHEGINVAQYFQKHGVSAFVLKYRLPSHGYVHPVPLKDTQRALRLVRSHAADWNIDPKKIGIMGFSAGGHLASTLETHFDAGDDKAADPVDKLSCRPDFAVLVYPVISMKEGLVHEGSRNFLLGNKKDDPTLLSNLSNETQVTAQTPPTYLAHSKDDSSVPVGNSEVMYDALQKAGVKSKLQEYPWGAHGWGYGAQPDNSPVGWLDKAYGWLHEQGFVPETTIAKEPERKTANYPAGYVWNVQVLDSTSLPNPGYDDQATNVWTYMFKNPTADGKTPVHDGKYQVMTYLDHNGWWSGNDCRSRIEWYGTDASSVAPPRTLRIGGLMAVLSWESPIDGTVDIDLLVNKAGLQAGGDAQVSLETSDGTVLWKHTYNPTDLKGTPVQLTGIKVKICTHLYLLNDGNAEKILIPTYKITVK